MILDAPAWNANEEVESTQERRDQMILILPRTVKLKRKSRYKGVRCPGLSRQWLWFLTPLAMAYHHIKCHRDQADWLGRGAVACERRGGNPTFPLSAGTGGKRNQAKNFLPLSTGGSEWTDIYDRWDLLLDNCSVTLQIIEFVLHDIPRIRRSRVRRKECCDLCKVPKAHDHCVTK